MSPAWAPLASSGGWQFPAAYGGPHRAKAALKDILVEMLDVGDTRLRWDTQPSVVLVIGVNGVGKTTTIGKLAKQLGDQGKRVLMCAGDTFRAAAADQLEIWAGRLWVCASPAAMRAPRLWPPCDSERPPLPQR